MNARAVLVLLLVSVFAGTAAATCQIADRVEYNGKTYSLIGLLGDLPTPQGFGMETEPSSTANWRGYFSVYRVAEGRLELHTITVNAKNGTYRTINGVGPDLKAYGGVYSEINLPIPFTGKLRLGGGFLAAYYIHMGFQKPSAFREVYDLEFESGRLVEVLDRSGDAEAIRGRFAAQYRQLGVEKAVEAAFSLDLEPLQ